MNNKTLENKIVYAIFPNANGFGFVYMENPRTLIDYGAVRINPINNLSILKRVKKAFGYLKPSVVIIQDPEGLASRTGARVRSLIEKIQEYCKSFNLEIFQFSRDRIREVFEEFGAKTKYEICKILVSEFKELESRIPKKRTLWSSEDRYMSIFDALSLAITAYYVNT